MNETKAVRIAAVKYVRDFVLRLRWKKGSATLVDLSDPVHRVKGLRHLRDPKVFAQATLGEGGHSIVWPGNLDMGADRIWEIALEQAGHQDVVEFIRWRRRHGLSLSEAAQALGLSRRQIAYYASGEHSIPRTVLLACKGWEVEQQPA